MPLFLFLLVDILEGIEDRLDILPILGFLRLLWFTLLLVLLRFLL